MLVCSCFAVSGTRVDAAIDAGAGDVDDVGDACGAGTGCGSCRQRIAQRLCSAGHAPCGSCLRCAEHVTGRAS